MRPLLAASRLVRTYYSAECLRLNDVMLDLAEHIDNTPNRPCTSYTDDSDTIDSKAHYIEY